jgi:putative lipoic acid-binding regulatory protein
MKDSNEYSVFKQQLEDHHTYPTLYLFKFIVPKEELENLKSLFPDLSFEIKPSKKGKYISASFKISVDSSDSIIEIYQKANTIKGIISL